MVFVVLLVSACALAQTMDKVAYTECKDPGTGKLLEVRLSSCATLPCVFKKGGSTTIQMDFIPSADTDKVYTGAVAQVGPIKLPFRGINQTPACGKFVDMETGTNVGCTLKAGKSYTYSYDLPILARYPTANAQVQWELLDAANRNKIACFQVPVKIAA